MARLALLGAGAMGESVLAALVASGWDADDIVVADQRPERQRELGEKYGVRVVGGAEAAGGADTVLVVVKPHDVASVLAEIGPALRDGAVVASLCAGVSTQTLEEGLPDGTPVVRVMPNTPALVGEGMFVVTAGHDCSREQLDLVDTLLRACGRTEIVPESHQDAAGAVSGSGPAYVFYVADALAEGGVLEGLPRDLAVRLAAQTLLGAARMLLESGESASTLREQVTSPGGSTAAALRVLDEGAVRHRFSAAVSAAAARAAEMGA